MKTKPRKTTKTNSALESYLRDYGVDHPYAHCPLPELYRAATPDLTIGQFHDVIRELQADRRIRLHPFTGAMYQLRDEQYAMVQGQEIKFYVELL